MDGMSCKEAESMIHSYINNELNDDDLEAFLEHINHCEDCKEELEIYYTVDVGVRQLDDEAEIYNITGALETSLVMAEQKVKHKTQLLIVKYVVDTLMVLSLVVLLLLQLRIWIQYGLL